MELNDLKIFTSVAKNGSMSESARILGYAQSNISERIHLLEQELNVPLFERSHKGVKLLPEGKQLLHYTSIILEQIELIERQYKNKKVKIGCTQVISANYFDISQMAKHGDASEFMVETTEKLLRMFQRSELDIIVTNRQTDNELENTQVLFKEKIGWLSQENCTQTVLLNRDPTCPYRKAALENMDHDEKWRMFEVDSLSDLCKLVERGEGACVLPLKSYQKLAVQNQELKFQPLEIEIPIYAIGSHEKIGWLESLDVFQN